jgi:hypothetical protein
LGKSQRELPWRTDGLHTQKNNQNGDHDRSEIELGKTHGPGETLYGKKGRTEDENCIEK